MPQTHRVRPPAYACFARARMLRARFSRWTRAREQVRERRERAREEREAGGDTGGADGGGRLVSCCAEERARVDDDVVARACLLPISTSPKEFAAKSRLARANRLSRFSVHALQPS